jgi:7-cyano-7-deazaguanine synthase
MKPLVILSGGVDSATALYLARSKYKEVEAVNFAYGSKHEKQECKCARKIADKLGVKLYSISMDFIGTHFKSSLLGGTIPEGEYNEKDMNSTVVPFRNGIMLSIAAGLAESVGCDEIVLGNHGGDHFVYPDCRPEFIKAMSKAVFEGSGSKVQIWSPFCCLSKTDIIRIGNDLGVDFADTYSCYNGGELHCGKCATCLERKKAFELASVIDPTKYEE